VTGYQVENIIDHYEGENKYSVLNKKFPANKFPVIEVHEKYSCQRQDRYQWRIHQEAFFPVAIHQQHQRSLRTAKWTIDAEKLFIGAGK